LKECDLAIITTDHSEFNYIEVVSNAPLVFDTRNATDGLRAKHLFRL
jgi:UDP-N-acetyl-D-glucosamine dehydrogenase